MSGNETALHADQYLYTMLEAALMSGAAEKMAVFELSARSLPGGRRFGVVAGTERAVQAIEEFHFEDDDVEWLMEAGVITREATAKFLRDYRFHGDVIGYPEGSVYFPNSPLLTLHCTYGEGVLLETLLLSILGWDSYVATTASRFAIAAGSKPLYEMATRRVNDEAAIVAARAAYIGGFAGTSNLAARRRYGLPGIGTSAHSFTLVHDSEARAFKAQIAAQGAGTTVLVDTYDVMEAVRTAVELAGPDLGAVRIDSGMHGLVSKDVRAELDSLGAKDTRIIASGDLDESAIAQLSLYAPIDGFGVGTKLVDPHEVDLPGFIFKLVAVEDRTSWSQVWRDVAKASPGKHTFGGRKTAFRRFDEDGVAEGDVMLVNSADVSWPEVAARAPGTLGTPLQSTFIEFGERIRETEDLEVIRQRRAEQVASLPRTARGLLPGTPAIPTSIGVPGELVTVEPALRASA